MHPFQTQEGPPGSYAFLRRKYQPYLLPLQQPGEENFLDSLGNKQNQAYIEAKDSDGQFTGSGQYKTAMRSGASKTNLQAKPYLLPTDITDTRPPLNIKRDAGKEGITDTVKPYDYVLMFLANMSDEGLTILPTHRLVKISSRRPGKSFI
jgi:hypothetical protein